jgi:hypothetical protein
LDEEQNVTRWVVIAATQSKTFQSEEEARDWLDDLWQDDPKLSQIKLMRVERYTSTFYRPSRATLTKRRK